MVEAVIDTGHEVELVVSDAGRRVLVEEMGLSLDGNRLESWLGERKARVRLHPAPDIGASIASGSYPVQGMVVMPCSTGTAARIAAGLSDDLIQRAADVQIKQNRPLVLVVRETPLSVIHLRNLLRLARAGATVLPASPGFYARPRTVDDLVAFVVERALDALGLEGRRSVRWQGS